MGFRLSSRGNFNNMEKFLRDMGRLDPRRLIEPHARRGVEALRAATPKSSGLTADSWGYEINKTAKGYEVVWTNRNVVDGFPVVIGLQYGHGTGTGGWVQGQDFINPAIRPVFDQIAHDIWKVVTSA